MLYPVYVGGAYQGNVSLPCPTAMRDNIYTLLQLGNFLPELENHLVKQVAVRYVVTVSARSAVQHRKLLRRIFRKVFFQHVCLYDTVSLKHRYLFRNAFELSDVSWPTILPQQNLRFVRKPDYRHFVFVCKIERKFSEKLVYVSLSLS